MTQVFAVEGSKNEVDFFFLVRNVAKGSKVRTEMLNRKYTAWWKQPDRLIIWSDCNQRNIWFRAEHIVHLAVSEEKHDTSFHYVLKDEVLIVVTNFIDI